MGKQPLNILCFGDSNTFGTNPSGGRWNYNERWPGILQNQLGKSARIIEEGLGGRITVKEDEVEGDKTGKRHLPVLLHSHRPLDLVIIMLGTNDMKQRFNMSAQDIARGAEELGQIVENYPYGEYYPVPKVLLISPIHIKPGLNTVPMQVSRKMPLRYLISLESIIGKWQKSINGCSWMQPLSLMQVKETSSIWKQKTIMHGNGDREGNQRNVFRISEIEDTSEEHPASCFA